MRATLLGLLVIVPLLAGCTDRASLNVAPTPTLPLLGKDTQTGEELFLKPNLTVGRYWTVRVAVDFGQGFLVDINGTIVVSGRNATGFRLGSDVQSIGVFDDYFDSFYVGSLDNDLNPMIQGKSVAFFEWPLRAGQTWTTKMPAQDFGTFDRAAYDTAMNVTKVEDDHGPFAPRLRIQGRTAHGETLDFDYSAVTGWMTYFRMVNASTGRVIVSVDYKTTGADFHGDVHHLTHTALVERVALTPPFDPSLVPAPDVITVPQGYAFVEEIKALFTFALVDPAGGGEVVVAITRPDGTVDKTTHTDVLLQHPGDFNRTVVRDHTAGVWTVNILPAATGGAFVGLYGFKDDVVHL